MLYMCVPDTETAEFSGKSKNPLSHTASILMQENGFGINSEKWSQLILSEVIIK